MEPAPNKLVTHFDEEERRDVFMIRIKEHQLDSSERLRILQELYDWFNLTKDLVVSVYISLMSKLCKVCDPEQG